MIRTATINDATAIAELTYMIWKDMELEIVENYDKSEVIKVIEESVASESYRNSYHHIDVYDVEGQVAGIIVTYDGDKELYYEESWSTIKRAKSLPLSTKTPLPVKEAEDTDRYIESIATFPQYRGRGIAKALMIHVFEKYRGQTFSLNCDRDNVRAKKLYENMGFKPHIEKTLYGHVYDYMIYTE
ncbi:GNAT family N-acetyltransferase [Staphylococcus agnetis]|uniref:GNAT family N-acetyltransferase n=1 Tax=Staphylococcus agnetis TaxID=985762 RepID=UPI0021D085D2|nr:GNAT family N-acetyltransferase [Staphylococcus agnetis]UXU58980.1 GNAT family N-acetyltransferase [Staphylococcus agnetis]UXU61305.1 GNAT family N-acetyltransferase [Staphylococcus agnetis]